MVDVDKLYLFMYMFIYKKHGLCVHIIIVYMFVENFRFIWLKMQYLINFHKIIPFCSYRYYDCHNHYTSVNVLFSIFFIMLALFSSILDTF